MPVPAENESRSDFVNRCIPIVLDDGTAEDEEQAAAICHSMFDDKSGEAISEHRSKDMHKQFVKRIRKRKSIVDQFGYGITTAEPYVRSLLLMEEAGCKTGRTATAEALLKESRERLCFASDGMVIEKSAMTSETEEYRNAFGDIKEPPNTLMLVRHVLTTDSEDRDGDILRTAGAKLDPKAPMLWQHQPFLPIGSVIRTVEQTASKLTVISALLDLNDITADAAKLIEANALRFSHGFRVLDYEPRKDSDGNEVDGFEVKDFEILEASLVSVPSNIDAEIELFARGKLESELVKAHAKHYMDNRPVMVQGTEMLTESNTDPVVDDKCNAVGDDQENVDEPVDDKDVENEQLENTEMITEDTKAGRVMSARNLTLLEEVIADLAELSDMELTRSAKALCERCVKRLNDILDAAKPDDEDDKDIETEEKDMPAVVPDIADVVNYVLSAPNGELAHVKHILDLVVNLDAYHVAGETYREFESSL